MTQTIDTYLDLYASNRHEKNVDELVFQEMGILDVEKKQALSECREKLQELERDYYSPSRICCTATTAIISGGIWGIFGTGLGYYLGVPKQMGLTIGAVGVIMFLVEKYQNKKRSYKFAEEDTKTKCEEKLSDIDHEKDRQERLRKVNKLNKEISTAIENKAAEPPLDKRKVN